MFVSLILLFIGEANSITNGISVAMKSGNTYKLISDFLRAIVDFEELVIEEVDAYAAYKEKTALKKLNISSNSKNETKYSTKNASSTLSWLEQMATQIGLSNSKATTPSSLILTSESKKEYSYKNTPKPTTTPYYNVASNKKPISTSNSKTSSTPSYHVNNDNLSLIKNI